MPIARRLRRPVQLLAPLILCLLPAKRLFADEVSAAKEKNEAKNRFVITVAGQGRILDISTSDQTPEATIMTVFAPNTPVYGSLAARYGGLGGRWQFKFPGSGKSEQQFGATSAQDYLAFWHFDRFGVDLFYQKYSGFYVSPESKAAPAGSGTIRPDIAASYYGTNIYFSIFKEFSIRSAFLNENAPEGFSWGILLGLSLNRSDLSAASTIVTTQIESQFPSLAGFTKGNYFNAALTPGLGVSYSANSGFFATLVLMAGGGYTYAQTETRSGGGPFSTDNFKANAKFTGGLNTQALALGLSIMTDVTGVAMFSRGSLVLAHQLTAFEGFASIRF